jgi:protocatechuate 3,4-dioxygenase beta subunit
MARVWPVLVALGISTAGIVGIGAQQPPRDAPVLAKGTASIHGRVTDADGRPLSRVEVRAGNGLGQQAAALTDGDGKYNVNELPAGVFTVVATKANYVRSSWGEQRVEGPGKRITLADGQKLDDINIRLMRTGAITGRIVDEFGDPVTDVAVMAMRYQYVQGSRRLMPSARGGQTNDIGEFRLYGLTPGQYYVSATLRNNFNPIGTDTNDRTGYAPTFYPGTGNVAEAQRLTIAPGQSIASINLTLLPITTSKISGTVIDSDGKPIPGTMVLTTPKASTQAINIFPTAVRPDGQFTITGLAPGEYVLRSGSPAGAADVAFAEVTVSGSDVSGVQLVMTKPSTIRGRIVFAESATSAKPPKATAIELGAVREWAMAQQIRSPAKIKDDGTFEISVPSGHVRLRAPQIPGGPTAPPWRLSRVLFNDLDVGDAGIDVPAGAAIENVVFEMTNHVYELSGRVTDADGALVRDCFVIVFAQDPARWTVQTPWLIVGRPGADDLYRVRLLPGDYYAVAMSEVEQNAWTDPDFLSLAREHATKVTIAEGDTKTLNLPLSPVPVF